MNIFTEQDPEEVYDITILEEEGILIEPLWESLMPGYLIICEN